MLMFINKLDRDFVPKNVCHTNIVKNKNIPKEEDIACFALSSNYTCQL